ncbi:MAG: hypothetical protein AB9844_01070 [Clostridiaceae bacterium]
MKFKKSLGVLFSIGFLFSCAALNPNTKNKIEAISYPSTLIASVDNMLVNYTGGKLILSTDGGATYSKSLAIPDVKIIRYIYLYNNGDVIFADHTKVYYSDDWKSYHESRLLNQDGSVWTPKKANDNFTSTHTNAVRNIVNGIEIAVWGNYSIEDGIQNSDNIKVWYSPDHGKTVKSCYVFNTSKTPSARHVHAVDFDPGSNTFWLQTGDDEPTSHWLKGKYNTATDTWSWTRFADGMHFKTTNMVFKGSYVYWSWDTTPGGVVKAPVVTMGDVSTHKVLFITKNDCIKIIIGPAGDIAAIQTVWGGTEQPRIFYYAPDGVNFVKIVGDMPSEYTDLKDAQYSAIWPINSNGKVLAAVYSRDQDNLLYWDRVPGVFIDDVLRKSGYPNAFKEPAKANGWIFSGGGWHYYNNGVMVVNSWRTDSHGWCYLDKNGDLTKGALIKDSAGLCYIGADGYWSRSMAWRMDVSTKKWSYIGSSGYALKNAWVSDSRGWCYLDAEGYWMNHSGYANDSQGTCIIGADGYWTGARI